MTTSTLHKLIPAFATLLIGSAALAGTATFQMIPNAFSANDMSPDGRFVVGERSGGGYILDTTTMVMTLLPGPAYSAEAVSDDGKVVVGNMIDPTNGFDVAAMWTAASGVWTSLGYLPTAGSCPSHSDSYEISADGSVVVGLSWINGCHGAGFRWTQATGMVQLESLANGSNRASVVSANGNLIGGFAQGSFSRTPAIWSADGQGQLLDPPSGDALGEVYGMNDAGTILLGSWNGDAVTWKATASGWAEHLIVGTGSLLPGWEGIPMDIANDGTIVGFDIIGLNRRAWIRPGASGQMIDLVTYLEANGATLPPDMVLQVPQAISTDGTKIVGHTSFVGAWIATIETPNTCVADIAPSGGDGQVDASDLGFLLGAWGGPTADLDGDGTTNASDLGVLLGAWGPCPAALGACCLDGSCSQMTASACATAGGAYLGDNVPCSLTSCANNDSCANAIDITANIDGAPVLGDNSYATPGFYAGPDPELPVGSPSCQWDGNPAEVHSTVWYSFTAPQIGVVYISLCDSNSSVFVDSTLGVYSGTCDALTEIACDEDGCGDPAGNWPYYSYVAVEGLTPGQTYYICVMNAGGWFGSVPGPFKLVITSP